MMRAERARGLRDPISSVVARQPGSVRRTTHLDVGPWEAAGPGALWMQGWARDAVTPDTAGPGGSSGALEGERLLPGVTALGETALSAGFDPERALGDLCLDPPVPWADKLLGTRAAAGFRGRIEEVAPEGDRSLARQLLDDLPAGALIAGYSLIRLAQRVGHEPAVTIPPERIEKLSGTCSGWRPGGYALETVLAGLGVPVQDCPPATDLSAGDPVGWHAIGPLAPDVMRRRRLVDVSQGEDGSFSVWAMFRDTIGEPGGGESVLHEYVVELEVGPPHAERIVGRDHDHDALVVRRIVAAPRVLPFPECPAAAGFVGRLVGVAVADLPAAALERSSGVECCTHLNDLLRSLGSISELARALCRSGEHADFGEAFALSLPDAEDLT